MTSQCIFDWRPFLTEFSRDMLADAAVRDNLPPEVVEGGWLGYAGASEAEIATLEKRIGARLPPSYRSFLEVTNGWRDCGAFIYELYSCSGVRWFSEQNQEWIDAYVHPESATSPPKPIPDKLYFVYGEKQRSEEFRAEYLQTALEISAVGDSAILLLNPKIVNKDGEW